MGIKRYFASQDNTITNALKANLTDSGSLANMGAADILETFVIHGQSTASVSQAPSANNAKIAEQTRFLIQFPISDIQADITASSLPNVSSSVQYYLNLYNAPHGSSTPLSYSLDINMVSKAWNEGRGLDMDNYTDLGASNWVSSSQGVKWSKTGGDFLKGPNTSASFFFASGLENMKVDISQQVYKWLNGTANHGLLIRFPDSIVSGSETMYTKKFFSRTSEFYLYRPTIEARWDSTRRDDRANFFISSSMAPSADNLNTLFLYNHIRGQLTNIPNLAGNKLSLSVYSGSNGPNPSGILTLTDAAGASKTAIEAGLLVENGAAMTGIYTASFASKSKLNTVYDVWFNGLGASRVEFKTGSYEPIPLDTLNHIDTSSYITTITNLKSSYPKGQKPTLRVFVRDKNWSPNIYNIATSKTLPHIIENAYYKISRTIDGMDVIPYGTGSAVNNYSRLSYDGEGNYFSLDTSFLDPGYAYNINFCFYENGSYIEQPETFKFRIEEDVK